MIAEANRVRREGERRKILLKPMCVGGGHTWIGDTCTCVRTHILY